ncbi:MAG: DNA repair protein RecN [Thermodesulfobacteriota bacterium]
MLVELRIKDFAIIEKLVIELAGGFNVFTGETGAGKSIIMDAVALVLGERAAGDIVRTGASEAVVEALFDVSGVKGIAGILSEAGIETTDDLVIKRVVARAGRNRIYINGSLATLVTLTEITRHLIDIYGQSEHQSLTRPGEHQNVLDAFGGLLPLRREMQSVFDDYISSLRERDSLTKGAEESAARRDLLAFQSEEIEGAALRTGEDDELRRLRERLVNAEKIKSAALNAQRVIYSESGAITERLGAVLRELKEVASFDDVIKGALTGLESNLYELEDAAGVFRDHAAGLEVDAARIGEIDERIFQIEKLKTKYAPTLEAIAELKEKIDDELAGLGNLDERLAEATAALEEKEAKAREVAGRLSAKRVVAAQNLKSRMESELATLGMKGAVFEVELMHDEDHGEEANAKFTASGAERVCFYISANPGEEVKPLSRVASGGELSRIMLAIKKVSAAGRVPTLIFDEIDTGIGGAMAHVVGAKMKAIAENNQILCITHLPQIAAFAQRHFVVTKGSERSGGERTVTSVRRLNDDDDESLQQIAWMLGGDNVTDATREHARELISAAGD